jgi:hypothetical protein
MSGYGASSTHKARSRRWLSSAPRGGSPDLLTDPFEEGVAPLVREPLQLLGARFRFESNSEDLLEVVDAAYAGLPRHKLSGRVPRLCVRLVLGDAEQPQLAASEPPPLAMFSGASLLGGATAASDFVIVAPQQRAALVRVSPRMLAHSYHTRYELIEFAVFTLAGRCQGLVPLHSACIGLGRRGALLMGASGSGKSTLALQCLLQGFDFVSEDSTFVTADSLLATGAANFLHVRPDSVRFVARASDVKAIRSSPTIRRRSGVRKLEIDLRGGGYRLAPAPLPIAAVVFLTPERAEGPLLVPLDGRAVANRLAAEQSYAAELPEWPQFCRSARRLQSFELRRGRHPQEGVEALRGLLGQKEGKP